MGSDSTQTKVESSHARTERFYLKLVIAGFLAVVLLVAVIFGGRKSYAHWRERRLTQCAMAALKHDQAATASLALRALLELNPRSAVAARMMAGLAEKAGDRSALDWRRKLVQDEPDSIDDLVAWAQCAVQFNDLATAEGVLARVGVEGKATADYHAAAALLAQAKGESDKEESEWSEALRLVPSETRYQLQLGIVRLRLHDPKQHEAGVAMLENLRNDPTQRVAAMRALIREGVARRDKGTTLLAMAKDLQAYPEAAWSDRLLYLDFLHQAQDPQFSSYLTDLERASAVNPANLAALLGWMNRNNLDLLALDFIKSLPAGRSEKWPIPRALADVYVQMADWKTLEKTVHSANWADFDFLRHAYLARSLREQDETAAAEHEWSLALKEVSTARTADGAMDLLRALRDWRWEAEGLDLLWAMAKNPEQESDAMGALYQYYAEKGDTIGLYRLVGRRCETRSGDEKAQNNRAQLALLLDVDMERAQETAERLYRKESTNSVYAATYAFSLYRQGKYQEAVQILSGLGPNELNRPELAAYYAIFLAAAGDKQRAAEYLNRSDGASLLPEERTLVQGARDNINAPP